MSNQRCMCSDMADTEARAQAAEKRVAQLEAERDAHDADVRANGDAVIAGLNAKVAELKNELAMTRVVPTPMRVSSVLVALRQMADDAKWTADDFRKTIRTLDDVKLEAEDQAAVIAKLEADLAKMTEQYKGAKEYCDKADTLRFETEAALDAAKKNPCGLCGIAAETARRERDAAVAEVAKLKAAIEWRDETNAKLRVRLAERSDELVGRAALIDAARHKCDELVRQRDDEWRRAEKAEKRVKELDASLRSACGPCHIRIEAEARASKAEARITQLEADNAVRALEVNALRADLEAAMTKYTDSVFATMQGKQRITQLEADLAAARTIQTHTLVQEVVEKARVWFAANAMDHRGKAQDALFDAIHDAAGITIQPVDMDRLVRLEEFACAVRDVGIRGQDDTVMRQRACEALGQKWRMEFTPMPAVVGVDKAAVVAEVKATREVGVHHETFNLVDALLDEAEKVVSGVHPPTAASYLARAIRTLNNSIMAERVRKEAGK